CVCAWAGPRRVSGVGSLASSRAGFSLGRESASGRAPPCGCSVACYRPRAALSPSAMESGPHNDLSRPDRRGAFLLLFFCLLAVGAGNTMLTSAVLPPLTRELKLPDWTAGAIFSLSAAVWVVTAPYWGAKSNVWGRRR